MSRTIRLNRRSDTEALAGRIAHLVRSGDVVLLSGPLGAGKSVFARAFLRALCEDPYLDVPSPTFTLVQHYEAPVGPVAHFDLWRLNGPEALEELGWDDALSGIVLVEWPERLEDMTPSDALHVTLTPLSDQAAEEWEDAPRQAVLSGWGGRFPDSRETDG